MTDPAAALSNSAALRELEECNRACTACRLRAGCLQVVVSDGPTTSELVIVGEAPGGGEDLEGHPFVGPGGQLLNRILESVGLSREACYVTNVVKCRPPGNRDPQPDEVDTCTGLWLKAQLALLRPKVILTLGNTSTQTLLQTRLGITKLRGQWFQHQYTLRNGELHRAWLMPMLHPAYLLRVDTRAPGGPKSLTWRDIQEVAAVLRGEHEPVTGAPLDSSQPRLF